MSDKAVSQMTSLREVVGSEGGRYVIEQPEPMAFGRESILWVARDERNQPVCLKIFREADAVPAQLFRELQAVQALHHPNILPVIDYQASGPTPFLALPLCKGGSLRRMLADRRFIPLDQALPIIRSIAEALDYAHANGFVHGDIKPENILFLDEERTVPLLSDFGMSRHFGQTVRLRESTTVVVPGQRTKDSSGAAGGTFAYFSPEQFNTGKVSPKSDVYALSLVVFEVLTGHFPYDVGLPIYHFIRQKLEGELRDAHALNAEVSEAVASVLARGLAAEPGARPVRAMVFYDELRSTEGTGQTPSRGRVAKRLAGWFDSATGPLRRFWRQAGVAGRVTLIATIITVLGSVLTALLQAVFGS